MNMQTIIGQNRVKEHKYFIFPAFNCFYNG
jgi:hypothetical protein